MVEQFNLPGRLQKYRYSNCRLWWCYTALDHATKMAEAKLCMLDHFDGGAANANTKLAGEVIGNYSWPTPAEVYEVD